MKITSGTTGENVGTLSAGGVITTNDDDLSQAASNIDEIGGFYLMVPGGKSDSDEHVDKVEFVSKDDPSYADRLIEYLVPLGYNVEEVGHA